MRNILTITRKEVNSYFRSPIAYSVLAVFAIIFGYFFYTVLSMFLFQSLTQAQYAQMYGGEVPPLNVNEQVIRPLLLNTGVVCLFLVPMITMRLFAEEKKVGTIELLMTSPLTDFQTVMGKFLAALFLYASMLGITVLYMAILFHYGVPDWRPLIPGYLGQLLLGACFISLGLLFSTLTKSQVIAGSLTFFALMLLWIIDWTSQYSGGVWGQIASYLSLTSHIQNFSKGVIDLKDTVYYLSVITLGLFLSVRSVESVRWRA